MLCWYIDPLLYPCVLIGKYLFPAIRIVKFPRNIPQERFHEAEHRLPIQRHFTISKLRSCEENFIVCFIVSFPAVQRLLIKAGTYSNLLHALLNMNFPVSYNCK